MIQHFYYLSHATYHLIFSRCANPSHYFFFPSSFSSFFFQDSLPHPKNFYNFPRILSIFSWFLTQGYAEYFSRFVGGMSVIRFSFVLNPKLKNSILISSLSQSQDKKTTHMRMHNARLKCVKGKKISFHKAIAVIVAVTHKAAP